jgi:DNA-binding GntR family transcriptional regulator
MVIFERKVKAQSISTRQDSNLEELESKKIVAKKQLKRLTVNELPQEVPDFKNASGTKDNLVAEYLTAFITTALQSNTVEAGNLLPTKQEIAAHLGVSIGTVQNAIRYIEDQGYVESKQRIGTMIRDINDVKCNDLRKQTSKRDIAIVSIKKHIIENGIQAGEALPSSRELAKVIGSAPNTTRLALEHLASIGVIDSKGCRGNKANWILREVPMISREEETSNDEINTDTLVDQVERDLKELIVREFGVNQKLPAHFELSQMLKVSIKTVHDAMKRLSDQGILKPKRGRYGTIIMRMPSAAQFFPKQESSIFATAAEASLYNYEKVERHLKAFIKDNYQINDKLPAMGKLAEQLNVSSNTVRKALQRLAEQGVVSFSRGRYGGTFVTSLPKVEGNSSFTWLSVNPQHVAAYRSTK